MSVDTSTSGGPNSAVGANTVGGAQSGPGASQRVTGREGDSASRDSGQSEGRSATGNQAGREQNPSNGGLAAVFQGGPEAGREREPGTRDGANRGPDRAGLGIHAAPKGNHQAEQSTDSLTNLDLPTWAQQLPKKLTSDPKQVAKLSAFKSMDDLVQAYLGAEESFALPGEKSSPEEIQSFYERLGKPKDEAGYSFAKNEPGFAKSAFEANLTSAQADALYRASQKQLDDLRQSVAAQTAKDFASTEGLLQKEFGDGYEEAVVLMRRGLGINPKTGELSPVAKALFDSGLAGKPEIVRAFIELGRATSEGTAAGGSSRSGEAKSVTEGRGFDYKESY